MTYIIVGKKKLGIEFLFALSSFLYTFLMTHYVTLKAGEPENIWFYFVSAYVFLLFFAITCSNPGNLDDKHKRIINQRVSFKVHLIT